MIKSKPMQIPQISPEESFEILKHDKNSVLVDVRTVEEFNTIGIADAKDFDQRLILLPWKTLPTMQLNQMFTSDLTASLSRLLGNNNRDSKIIFMCKSGVRSLESAKHMVTLGYQNCYNMTNGFEGASNNGWKFSNLPWKELTTQQKGQKKTGGTA